MDKSHGRRRTSMCAVRGVCVLALAAVAGCVEPQWTGPFRGGRPGQFAQEGTVVVRDGEEAAVAFKTAFQSPPRVEVTGFVQSWFKDEPYRKSSFEIVQLTAIGFKIRSNHREQSLNSWSEVKWKATGAKARKKSPAEMSPQERLVAQVEKLGGKVQFDAKQTSTPLVGIDLHQTKTSDADLQMLHGLTSLKTLNLYGTKITDAGLTHLAGLTGLQTLHLNGTAITDAGLDHLRGLTGLKELNLYETRITDAGLRHVAALTGLQNLTLGGKQITDQGLKHLRTLRELHQICLSGTSVTDAGVKEMQRLWPRIQVIR